MNFDCTRITNHESVTRLLGGWPSFDDFEVVSMLLERSRSGDDTGPWLTIQFSGFRPDAEPESPSRNNCLLTLRFADVENLKLDGFNHQNAINGLVVSAKRSARLNREIFNVELVQGFGVGCTFECDAIDVVSVTPVETNGKPSCA